MPAVDVAGNLERLAERLASVCARAGRAVDSVKLVAVSKKIDLDLVHQAVLAGQLDLGESRLQEALPRQDALAGRLGPQPPTVRWHFIGHLQRNKAGKAAGRFVLIHGVHSLELAERLNRKASELGIVQPLLLQVNMTGEPQKDGLAPEELIETAGAVAGLPHIELRGLMAMAREGDREADLRSTFAAARELRDRAEIACGQSLPELSLGMSDDYPEAILEGATLVRLGTAVFGPRRG
jgi:PLP dependent protein